MIILKRIDWFNLYVYSMMVISAYFKHTDFVLVFGFALTVKSIRELK